jgi:hypothetical protein
MRISKWPDLNGGTEAGGSVKEGGGGELQIDLRTEKTQQHRDGCDVDLGGSGMREEIITLPRQGR